MGDKENRGRQLSWGWRLSTAWIVALFLYAILGPKEYSQYRELDKVGSLLQGAFAPLAFLWLVITVLQQSKELALQREELALTREAVKLQTEALKKSVEQRCRIRFDLEPGRPFSCDRVGGRYDKDSRGGERQ